MENRFAAARRRYLRTHMDGISTGMLLTDKLDALTKRVDKHNGLVERTYRLEEQASVFDEKMKVANHRIADLEEHTGCACKNL